MKHLVLLGGGYAHVHVLRQLARSPLAGTQVTLVTPQSGLIHSGMVPGWLAGHHPLDDCTVALAPLAEAAGVKWLEASAVDMQAGAKQLLLSSGEALGYDWLSIDTGPSMDRDLVPGARGHALFVQPIEHFARLSGGLLELAQARQLSIVLIGGGAVGVELALALQHRLGEQARISIVTGGTPPLPGYPEGLRARATAALRRARVAVLQERCTEITAGQVVLANGARLACDAPLAAWVRSAPPWLAESGLALDDGGFVQTNAMLQSLSHPEVFAVGDVAGGQEAPQLNHGAQARRSGPTLFENLRRSCAAGPQASSSLRTFAQPARPLHLLACGDRRAIGSWGGWSAEGSWVWRWKDRLDRRFVAR